MRRWKRYAAAVLAWLAAGLAPVASGAQTPSVPAVVTSTAPRLLTVSEADLLRMEAQAARNTRIVQAKLALCEQAERDLNWQLTATASAALAASEAGAIREHDASPPTWLLYIGLAVLAGVAGGAGALLCRSSGCGR